MYRSMGFISLLADIAALLLPVLFLWAKTIRPKNYALTSILYTFCILMIFSLVLRGSRGLILEALIPIFLYYQNRYKLGIIKSALSLLLIFLFSLIFLTLRAGLGIESGILYSLLRSFAMTFSNYELLLAVISN